MKSPHISFAIVVGFLTLPPGVVHAFELIAHRGVHQTYSREDLDDETCTANRIKKAGHDFIENTIPSIREAFRYGATMVELDVHPTTEQNGQAEQLAVIHDWTLDCRTDATCNNGCACDEKQRCITNKQSLTYLQKLDICHGYTSDNGNSFPFRGRCVGLLPTLQQALSLLVEYPETRVLINTKGNFERTDQAFLRIISEYPLEVRRRVHYEYKGSKLRNKFLQLGISEAIYQGHPSTKECLKKYLALGAFGYFPEACRNTQFFIPLHESLRRLHPWLKNIAIEDVLWGWPDAFIERAHKNGSRVFVSMVDSIEDYDEMTKHGFDGIMTNRIELIGPLYHGR